MNGACYLAAFSFMTAILLVSAVQYDHQRSFDNNYKLFWAYNASEEIIYFKVEVKTTGWVGLGFSNKNSGMQDLDCIVGGGFGGNAGGYITDYHATSQTRPTSDSSQSYALGPVGQMNGKTSLEFSRRRATGDANDMQFTVGSGVYVAWAYHASQGAFTLNFPRHSSRGYSNDKITIVEIVPNTTTSAINTEMYSSSVTSPTQIPTPTQKGKDTSSQGMPGAVWSPVLLLVSVLSMLQVLH